VSDDWGELDIDTNTNSTNVSTIKFRKDIIDIVIEIYIPLKEILDNV
jgi:hypothetical protein